jgi:hypothetical protein
MAEDTLHDKIEKVESVSSSRKPKEIAEEIEAVQRVPPDKEHFDSLMGLDQQRAPKVVKTDAVERTSLMDQINSISHKVDAVSKVTPAELIAQTQSVIKQIQTVKTQLATPNLEIKSSVQSLMKSKLSHIDESLKVAMNRAGMEYTPQPIGQSDTMTNPIERFLGFLTHGQYQLERLSNDVSMMQAHHAAITPANMLAMQIKVGYITQEIEFFISLLNKALESTKSIMNVQI